MNKRNLLLASIFSVPLTIADALGQAGIIFSEYVEGSANNKALEIYNGSQIAVERSNYQIVIYANGSSTPTTQIALPSGPLAVGGIFVIAHSGASVGLTSYADSLSSSLTFNGNDAVALRRISDNSAVDIIGTIGNNPGIEWGVGSVSTADNTLQRKLSIVAGDTTGTDAFDPAIEWDGFAMDTFVGLGSRGITDVQNARGNIPSTVELFPNFPNPFNPSTMIRYGLPWRSHTTLTVFNALGQHVATLVNGEMEAGYHNVLFDGTGLASGVYLYRLQAGEFVETKKLIVLK